MALALPFAADLLLGTLCPPGRTAVLAMDRKAAWGGWEAMQSGPGVSRLPLSPLHAGKPRAAVVNDAPHAAVFVILFCFGLHRFAYLYAGRSVNSVSLADSSSRLPLRSSSMCIHSSIPPSRPHPHPHPRPRPTSHSPSLVRPPTHSLHHPLALIALHPPTHPPHAFPPPITIHEPSPARAPISLLASLHHPVPNPFPPRAPVDMMISRHEPPRPIYT
ncbi:hypothetical protein VTO73DRAFT_8281 [Trametes versicolor]